MESGLRIYNVDPLVEKAHFGKLTVVLLIDINFCAQVLMLNLCSLEHELIVHKKMKSAFSSPQEV